METAEHSAPDRACILQSRPPKSSGIFAEEGVKGVHKPEVCTGYKETVYFGHTRTDAQV